MNRLAQASSPYLIQHKDNPVDWYEWSDAAFEAARQQDKPIFLSIGYSTCHWCHVMAHDCFEDDETATAMNATFINIKVDREERPDIDHIYMDVCQTVTGHGGWPLSIIMTPEKKPFFAGTYIPKEDRNGRMGMLSLSNRVQQAWQSDRAQLLKAATEICSHLIDVPSPKAQGDADLLHKMGDAYKSVFEPNDGGFGSAPKFPTPHNLMFLLRLYHQNKDATLAQMVIHTLKKMRLGGLWDHIGFGFHRYSTDSRWLLPHFEKMLYDQALMMMAYTEAWQIQAEPLFKQTVFEIATYVKSRMTDPAGGFYSAEDADSDGEEGKFYVWTTNEIRQHLGTDADWFIKRFHFADQGNFREEHSGAYLGVNIPHLGDALDDMEQQRFDVIRKRLFDIREHRIHPHLDDKVLSDWNGLMIAALAKAAMVFQSDELRQMAQDAMTFLNTQMMLDGRLLKRYRAGQAGLDAHISDYAAMIWAAIELYECTTEPAYLNQAQELTDIAINWYMDGDRGGFYFTAHDAEALLTRPKDQYDGAIPSGNSIMAFNLIRLARLTGERRYERIADEILELSAAFLKQHATGGAMAGIAMMWRHFPTKEIVLVPGDDERTSEFLTQLQTGFHPNLTWVVKNDSLNIDYIADMKTIDGQTAVYVCEDFACQAPSTELITG